MEIKENKIEVFAELKELFPSIEIIDEKYINKYGNVEKEYNLLKYGVAVRNLSHYSKIFIHGKDSESLLKRLATNKIVDLNVLEWVKTLFVNSDGNIIDRTMLLKFEDYFILIGSNSEKGKLLKWIKRFVINDDISLKNVEEDYSVFEILGTQASSFISMILGDKFSELNDRNILRVQVEDFFVHGVRVVDVNGVEKFVILVESKYAIRMLKILEGMKSVYDFGMVGEEAYNIFRIENGIPIAPNELNDNVNPVEVNLLDEISADKTNYIGHEIIKDDNNHIGKLVKISFIGNVTPEGNNLSIINDLNNEVGIITSIANSINMKNTIALGFVNSNLELNDESFYAVSENEKLEIKIQNL